MRHLLRITTVISAGTAPVAALAHPGHLTEVAGHGHWLGAAAIGAAVAIGLWQALKGRRNAVGDNDAAESADPDPQDA